MIRWTLRPGDPTVLPRLLAAADLAVHEGAGDILDAAVALCPVDTGALADSGQVDPDGPNRAVVSFGRNDDAGRGGRSTADYAVIVHERLDVAHPHGEAKFLERPLHNEAAAVHALAAERLRKALG